ncbi:ubiquinol-cytochrome-c reductase complex assembly factor 3 [Centropristis striata]|uniref:ubiquinol-cytochrome-c reductase complex assembly factor 3 n=1 Tax=Centropristis striata TaxID=184440 RepID=UPI0027DFAE8F|nr:ubiquinol-cytochrome-c reductase complex assembly factor 3 [Centropristis striata]
MSLRTILGSTFVMAGLGLGYGMWSMISPGDEQRRERIKNLPESNPVRMEESRRRNALVMQAIKEAGETNYNIARGLGGSSK